MNGSYGSTHYEPAVDAAVQRIVQIKPDLVISTGDMVAGQRRPHLSQVEVESMWSAYHKHVSWPIEKATIPYVATPGNHDGSAYKGFSLERNTYAQQWLEHKADIKFLDQSHYPFYYAFEMKGVLFISLDATTVGALPEAQMHWLRAVLTKQAGSHSQRVVFSHIPLWPTAQGRESEHIGDQSLQNLLVEFGVDLFLSGHHHAFYPGVKDGVAFISQSCLGAGPRRLIGTQNKAKRSFTVLEFSGDEIGVAAYVAPQFETPLNWSSLPKRIRSSVAELQRADLAPSKVQAIRHDPALKIR